MTSVESLASWMIYRLSTALPCAEGTKTYLVVYFLRRPRQVNFLLEDVARPIQLDGLRPVIEGAGYVHLVGIVRPRLGGRRSAIDFHLV